VGGHQQRHHHQPGRQGRERDVLQLLNGHNEHRKHQAIYTLFLHMEVSIISWIYYK
jgi:hypothetical protein